MQESCRNNRAEFVMVELHALRNTCNQNKTKSLVPKCCVLINNNTLWYIKKSIRKVHLHD